jgi:RNA polymerase sigma-32 factor
LTPGNGDASFKLFLADIRRVPVLSPEEERRLAVAYRATGDLGLRQRLVTANLRFVVRVAASYRWSGLRFTDLVQEGSLGLLRAVERFDPDKGVRLITFASWWIRAGIQNHVLRSWSMVALGTTQAQRRLFYALPRALRDAARDGYGPEAPEAEGSVEVARRLKVRPSEVEEMRVRMGVRDLSLDAPTASGEPGRIESIPSDLPSQDDVLADAEGRAVTAERVQRALEELDDRERYIVEHHLMSDEPASLQEVGAQFGITRERTRQIEARATRKLRQALAGVPRELSPEGFRIPPPCRVEPARRRPVRPAAKRILVVDDNTDERILLEGILEEQGFQVASAANGRLALRTARRTRPDLILLDLVMPVMSGWEFRAAQASDPALRSVPVIVTSSFANDLGVAAVFPKPFVVTEVIDAVLRLAA